VRATVTSVTISRGCAHARKSSTNRRNLSLFGRFHCASLFLSVSYLRKPTQARNTIAKTPGSIQFITPFAFPLHSTSFSLFLVSFYFPLFVFLIVLLFSFCSLRFLCLRLLIFMYITLFYSQLQSDIVSPSFSHLARTRRTRIPFPFDLRTSAHPHNLPPSPHSFLEPVSHPSRTLTSATAVVCFVLGTASGVPAHHRQRSWITYFASSRMAKVKSTTPARGAVGQFGREQPKSGIDCPSFSRLH
jgi:hypothetical protein